MSEQLSNENAGAAPPWKCVHGIYTAGDPTGRAPYCSWCTPEGPPEGDELEPRTFQTCVTCWKTLAIEEFQTDAGEHSQTCADCAPHPRVPHSQQGPQHGKERFLRRRDRYKPGDFTMEAWLQKCERAGWVCPCGAALTPDTVICARRIPGSRGGTNDIENCFPACTSCHRKSAASSRWHGRAA